MQPRTQRQKEVLEYITRFIDRHGYEPSYQQIAWNFGVSSKATIAKHVAALEKQGLLSRRRANGKFGIALFSEQSIAEAVYEVPWFEFDFMENSNGYQEEPLFIPRCIFSGNWPQNIRAFRVVNNAMQAEHICTGDIALLEIGVRAMDGDCVLALIDDRRLALKKYYLMDEEIELRPANPNFPSLFCRTSQVEIQGVLRGILRCC
jgi:repressor LexA